ncbi:disease resistance protein Pik-2-like [Triticum dicoccoides]|uniref:disease resistance protein Pik-2-like n=1 Tax=Triticum dicoccoides TaxID=85692 RepID=UPI001891DB7E|nr:disease resistance protein Pik-2-like [Triticum dicoccoides]
MAELLVLGLAKTVVQAALSKVKAAVEEEKELRANARGNMVLITLEFEMIHSFLDVATEERVKNNLVKTWVRQVRELAYDLEDCIEFVVHLDNKPTWCFRLFPCWPSSALHLDMAVAELQQMRTRAEELGKSYLRYSHIMDSDPKLFKLQQHVTSGDAAGAVALNMLLTARGAMKRQPCFRDLAQLITKKDVQELRVISVWETVDGDLGTTSIIRKVYNDTSFIAYFTCRAWVKITHPFNSRDFIRSIMAQFYENSCKDSTMVGTHVLIKMDAATNEDLVKEFKQLVTEKRYLIVLEGFSNMLEWDAIRTFLPDMKNGSWIIVSTQRFEIASLCIGHSYQLTELKQFSPEHSVCALFKEGCQGDGDRGNEPVMFELGQRSAYKRSPSTKEVAHDWVTKYPLVGRDSEVKYLRQYIIRARIEGTIISVWGITGIGKSALVRYTFCNMIITTSRLFEKYVWVDASHPFSLSEFCRSILSEFHSEKDPIEKCREILQNQRCLLVIDDLQSKEEWDIIHTDLLSAKGTKSVVVVITTERSIATYCSASRGDALSVKGLKSDASFDLFQMQVQRAKPSFTSNHLIGDLEDFVPRCGGLPKVIVAIADVLARHTRIVDNLRSLEQRFIVDLETKPEYDNLQGLFDSISSYFRTCQDSLKPCIIYLTIFPRHHIIRRRRIVRRWAAEGYLMDSHEETADEIGEMYFSKLLDVSIIQEPEGKLATAEPGDTRSVLCEVNGFFHEYIMSRRLEENFVFELLGNCALTNRRTGRHLVIRVSWDRNKDVFKSIDFSRLRSLTVLGEWKSFFISDGMKLLRVLDLEDARGVRDDDLEKMMKWLHRLKFLSLRGQREIHHLPSSLGYLRQLETLDVRYTSIATLPGSITKLQKLQYIRAGSTTNSNPAASAPPTSSSSRFCTSRRHMVGVEVPRGLGELTGLHTLGVINVGASRGKAVLEELKKLTQLRKLGMSGISRKNKEFLSLMEGHGHLKSLSVHLDQDNKGCLDDISLPWKNLKSLKLYGLADRLPLSSNPDQYVKLRKLTLEMDTLKKNDIEFLSVLSELCILRLRVKQLQDGKLHFHVEMYGIELSSFQKVKILEIACSSSELHVSFGSKSMKNLELLEIDYSSGTSYQLAGLNNLSELKQVLLKGTDDEAFRREFASHLASHPRQPVVKLEEQLLRSS